MSAGDRVHGTTISAGTSDEGPINRLLQAIDPFRDIWRSVEVRYSILEDSGQWCCLSTRMLFSARDLGAMTPETFVDIPRIRAGRFSIPASEGFSALSSLRTGRLRVGPLDVLLASVVPKSSPLTLNPYSWWFEEGQLSTPRSEIRYNDLTSYGHGFTLLGTGEQIARSINHNEWSTLGRSMISGEPPVIGFEDLAEAFLRRVSPFTPSHPVALSVVAPLYSRFEEPDVARGESVSIIMSGPPTSRPADFQLVVLKRVMGDLMRDSYVLGEDDRFGPEPRSSGAAIQLAKPVSVTEADWLGAYLLFRKLAIDQLAFPLPAPHSANPRIRVLQALDEGDRRVRELLAGNKKSLKDNSRFEIGVSWILQFCGFQVLLADLSGQKLSEGGFSDLIAFVPLSKSVVICEATIDTITVDRKLVKLAHRTESARSVLQDDGVEVIPVIATANQLVTEPERTEAASLGIAILSLSDLNTLFEMADKNESPSACLGFIKSHLPPKPASG